MRTRLASLLLLTTVSCSRLNACFDEPPPAPVTVSVAKVEEPTKATDAFAQKYVVIVATERTGEALAAAKAKLEAAKVRTTQLESMNYSGLKPCFSLLVVSAHATKEEAVAASEALKPTESYVRNTRDFVGDHPARAELCRPPEKKTASDLWLVTTHGLLLGASNEAVQLKTEDHNTWWAPIRANELGGVTKGEEFRVLSADGAIDKTCKVKGFQAVVRGVPHFGYFQEEPPPEAPGCGLQDDFAILDCELPEDAVALRARELKEGVPDVYKSGEAPAGVDTAALAKELQESGAYQQALTGLNASGQEGAAITETTTHQFFTGKQGTVVYSEMNLSKPLENEECGMTEVKARISRAILVQPTNHIELLPAERRDDTQPLGFGDFDLDGEVETILDESLYTRTRSLHRGGEVLFTDSVQFCDCPC